MPSSMQPDMQSCQCCVRVLEESLAWQMPVGMSRLKIILRQLPTNLVTIKLTDLSSRAIVLVLCCKEDSCMCWQRCYHMWIWPASPFANGLTDQRFMPKMTQQPTSLRLLINPSCIKTTMHSFRPGIVVSGWNTVFAQVHCHHC